MGLGLVEGRGIVGSGAFGETTKKPQLATLFLAPPRLYLLRKSTYWDSLRCLKASSLAFPLTPETLPVTIKIPSGPAPPLPLAS